MAVEKMPNFEVSEPNVEETVPEVEVYTSNPIDLELSPEYKLEKSKEVIESAQKDRASWLKQLLESRFGPAIDTALDWTPGVTVINAVTRAASGKTITGRVLNGKERIMISMAAAATSVFYSTIAMDQLAGTNLTKIGIATQLAGTMLTVTNSLIINKEFIKNNLARIKEKLSGKSDNLVNEANKFIEYYDFDSFDNEEFKNNLNNEWEAIKSNG